MHHLHVCLRSRDRALTCACMEGVPAIRIIWPNAMRIERFNRWDRLSHRAAAPASPPPRPPRVTLPAQGVAVAAYGTDEFPAFFTRTSGCRAPCRVDTPEE